MSDITILPKGGSINIQEKAPTMEKAVVGAGWDPAEGVSMDLDLTAITVGADGKAKEVVYYGNKDAAGLHHTGDNITGEGEGDDEQIEVTFKDLPQDINEVQFLVNIYEAAKKSQNFGQVKNSHVRVLNSNDSNKELARHDLAAEYASNTGVMVAKFVRSAGSWNFQAVGEGVNGDIKEILKARNLE